MSSHTTHGPAIIQCAVNGGEIGPNPNVPRSPASIARQSIDAAKAGAAVIHVHAFDEAGTPTQDPAIYRSIMDEIRSAVPEVVFNLTILGSFGMSDEQRLQALDALPEIGTIDCGTTNWGEDVIGSSPSFIEVAVREMVSRGIRPELHALDVSWLRPIARLIDQLSLKQPPLLHFYFSRESCLAPSLLSMGTFAAHAPENAVIGVTADGEDHIPTMAIALAQGWHVRTGLEDVVWVRPGTFATSNANLVERARRIAESLDRPIATGADVRELLFL